MFIEGILNHRKAHVTYVVLRIIQLPSSSTRSSIINLTTNCGPGLWPLAGCRYRIYRKVLRLLQGHLHIAEDFAISLRCWSRSCWVSQPLQSQPHIYLLRFISTYSFLKAGEYPNCCSSFMLHLFIGQWYIMEHRTPAAVSELALSFGRPFSPPFEVSTAKVRRETYGTETRWRQKIAHQTDLPGKVAARELERNSERRGVRTFG